MIPNFMNFCLLNESCKKLDDIELNPKGYTYGQIKSNFERLGYKFYGTIYFESKNNASSEECNIVPDKIFDLFNDQDYSEKFTSMAGFKSKPSRKYVDISIHAPHIDDISIKELEKMWDDFREVIKSDNVDSVTTCKTKKDKLYYVFFNNREKYFYFAYRSGAYTYDYFDLWLRVKTNGVDKLYDDLMNIYNSEDVQRVGNKNKEFRLEREEKERKRREEEKLKREKEEKFKTVDDEFGKIIKEDIEKNIEKYKLCETIPESIRESIRKHKDHEIDFEYGCYSVSGHGYMGYSDDYILYYNNKDLSDGYILISNVSSNRYMGD